LQTQKNKQSFAQNFHFYWAKNKLSRNLKHYVIIVLKRKKKSLRAAQLFFLKKTNKSNKIRHHKTAKNKFKLGRKKKQITKHHQH